MSVPRFEALDRAGRSMAALFGGYAFASAWAVFVAAVLPLPRPQAVLLATLSSFAAFLAIIVFSFAARNLRRWAAFLLAMILLLGGSGLVLSGGGQ